MPRGQRLYDEDDMYSEEEEEEEYWEEEGAHEPDAAAQQSCLDALKRDLGDAFTDADLWNAAMATGFSAEAATAWLLEPPPAAPTPPPMSGLSLRSPQPLSKPSTARPAAAEQPAAPRAGAKGSADVAAAAAPRASPARPQPPPPPPSRALNLAVIGHVDAGKSTLSGRLLLESGAVSEQAMAKLRREAAQAGKGSFAYAWLLDEDATERSRGLTVDVARAQLRTATHDVALLDTPGHREFVPAMLTGAAQADAALLVANASPGEFAAGLRAQTREHAVLCRSLGVQRCVVAVNQMDRVAYAQQAFDAVREALGALLAEAGFAADKVSYVPCAAFLGENVTRAGGQLPWWRGPTVLGAIEALPTPRRDTAAPARLTVLDAYKSRLGGALTLAVRVNAGAVRAKDRLLLLPPGELVTVRALACAGEPAAVLADGQSGEIAIAPVGGGGGGGCGVALEALAPQPGWVLCAAHAPATTATEVEAKVLALQLRRPLVKGDAVELHAHCACAPAVISRLVCLLDAQGAVLPPADGGAGRPRCLRSAQHAIIRVRLGEGPICLETFAACPTLSRFSLRAGSETVLVGVITAIVS